MSKSLLLRSSSVESPHSTKNKGRKQQTYSAHFHNFLLCEEIDFYLSTFAILFGFDLFLLIFCALPLFPLLPHSLALVSTLILDDQDSSSSSFLLWYLLSIPPGGDEKVPIRIKSGLPHSPRKLKNPSKQNFPIKCGIDP